MNTVEPTTSQSLGRDLLFAARYYLGGRRGLLLLGAIAAVAGVASSWSWLVAAGIAPPLRGALRRHVRAGPVHAPGDGQLVRSPEGRAG